MMVSWWIRSVKLNTLAKSGVKLGGIAVKFKSRGINTLARPRIIFIDTSECVNNYCFLFSMRLIFVSTDGMNCWNTEESDSKSIHAFNIRYIFLYL